MQLTIDLVLFRWIFIGLRASFNVEEKTNLSYLSAALTLPHHECIDIVRVPRHLL